MKIIHVSDLHLGSKIGIFPKEIANQRKNLIRERFRYVVNYASQNNIKVISSIFLINKLTEKAIYLSNTY